MTKHLRFFLLFIFCFIPYRLFANTPLVIPESLEPWKGWVLQYEQDALCPVPYDRQEVHLCLWPTDLSLSILPKKSQFSQKVTIYAEGFALLPGDENTWPQEVKVNGKLFPVLSHQKRPSLFLKPGEYLIEGVFYFEKIPDFLQIPEQIGILSVSLNNLLLDQPERDNTGKVWFHRATSASLKETEENKLTFKVFRLIQDEIPMVDNILIRLNVSGEIREIVLGPVLLKNALPLEIQSHLPHRLEENGMLRLQIKPGIWDIRIKSRFLGEQHALSLAQHAGEWPKEEIWSFEAQNALRLVEIEGGISIDPAQTDCPPEWRRFPTYLMKPENVLRLVEKQRGQEVNRVEAIQLQRKLWLDFSGKGMTAQDTLTGNIEQHWRLSLLPPFHLESVKMDGQDKLITQMGPDATPGVEIRQGRLHLDALSRITAFLDLPAVGWDISVQSLSTTLFLPPGWMLLGAKGVDKARNAWIEDWTLLDFFLVLIITASAFKLLGMRWGIIAFIALILIYREKGAPIYSWLNLIAAIAVLKVLPEGRGQYWVRRYYYISFVVLLMITIPFMVQQVRSAIYPQLALPNSAYAPSPLRPLTNEMRLMKEGVVSSVPQAVKKGIQLPHNKLAPLVAGSAFEPHDQNAPLEEYDPNAKIQTGPGVPTWQWNIFYLDWNGPVSKTQTIKLWLIPSVMTSILKCLQVALIGLLIYALARKGASSNTQMRNRSEINIKPKIAFFALFLLGSIISVLAFTPQRAYGDFPSERMLDDLKKRLLETPACIPECGDIAKMQVQIAANQLTLRLVVHTATKTAIPIPSALGKWMPRTVMVDHAIAKHMQLDASQQLWLELDEGVHEIILEGPIGTQNQFSIHMPLKPKWVTLQAEDWEVSGLSAEKLQGEDLYFSRLQSTPKEASAEKGGFEESRIPPFVTLTRTFQLGFDWEIVNELRRVAPLQGAIHMNVPLLQEELPLSEQVQIKEGKAWVVLGENQKSITWRSKLKIAPELRLVATPNPSIKETWELNATTTWHCEFVGIPAIHQQNTQQRWFPSWQPWPGEKLTIQITKPTPMPGEVLTVDNSVLQVIPGRHESRHILQLSVRTTQGSNHTIQIPSDAVLEDVLINGLRQPIHAKEGEIVIPLTPGAQKIAVRWQSPKGIAMYYSTPVVNLHTGSSNAEIQLGLNQNRWILYLVGPAIGPAILFWGLLIVIWMLAFGLSRSSLTPLKTWQWLLLGIGLTIATPLALILVVTWFIAMHQREKIHVMDMKAGSFQWMQIGLIGLTIAFIVSLFTSISEGLLGLPHMQLQSPYFNGLQPYLSNISKYQLQWYQDLSPEKLPQAVVFSLPLYIYRMLMLLWALWLAFSLVQWLRWGWSSFSTGGYWRARISKPDGESKKDE